MASPLESSDEKTNSFKLMRLIVDGGTEALRNAFWRYQGGSVNLQVVLLRNQHILFKLTTRRKIINDDQWNELYPPSGNPPNINNFDITLLSILLRNICGLSPPKSSGWDDMPSVADTSDEANVVRIKLFRNKCFAHLPNTSVTAADFKKSWAEISSALVRLGIKQSEIDKLEHEQCGEEEVKRVLKEWEKSETEIMIALQENLNISKQSLDISKESRDISKENFEVVNEMKGDVKRLVDQKCEEPRFDNVLNKHLFRCNFEREIELYNEKFTQGTREWVFDKFLNWFNDETSKNRAFIISGVAGMGKSVIAAVICKRFAEYVGASHFFQYNNDQYNNPEILFQSLAWQLCQILPAYKTCLVEKLSGKLGQSLNSMNIEALFSILFKEPFSSIADPEKRILIVLDALDESVHNKRHELASLISCHLQKLPSYIRFVITTRPEQNLIDKFEPLSPLIIKKNDEKNFTDLKLVIEEMISGTHSATDSLINSLAERCDGLMLYAFFLSEIYNDEPLKFSLQCLPKGIEDHYERYFRRLERELNLLGITEDTFHSLLSVLAIIREPLPEAFLEALCGFQNSKKKLQKVRKTISSLLVVKEDKSISLFHKSLRDWLVDEPEHDYSVDVQDANKIIFELCVKKLDDLKKRGFVSVDKMCSAIKYSLKYFLPHMLEVEDSDELENFVFNYVADLEVMFASVCVDVDLVLNNVFNLINHDKYDHVSKNTRTTVERLFSMVKRYCYLFRDHPQTFLQNVLNECGEELSSKASSLLQTRYKDIVYFEFHEKDRENDALEFRCLLSGRISGIDISPKHDSVVCCYQEGAIELFSLATGRSEWKLHNFKVELPALPYLSNYMDDPCILRHCIVFHPHENLILPGTLDNVITMQGEFSPGPFECDEQCSKFTSCCFSPDNSKLVTNCGDSLIIWDVSSGKKERCLECKLLFSFSFTASGSFFATVDFENVFNVYDVANGYTIKAVRIRSQFPVEIIATFKEDFWFCFVDRKIMVLNHNLTVAPLSFPAYGVMDIILPSSLYSQELESFLLYPRESWFSKVKKILNDAFRYSFSTALRYIMIGDLSVLIYSCSLNAIHVFSIKGLIDSQVKPDNFKGVFSNISRNGDFVYLNNTWSQRMTICNVTSNKKHLKDWQHSDQVNIPVVKDGVVIYNRQNPSLELWNTSLSQRLASFDHLAGVKRCLSVSDELIVCVYLSSVIFFNVVSKEIESRTYFNAEVRSVFACSIRYHVLAQIESSDISLWKEGSRVNGWEDIFDKNTSLMSRCITFADFSPNGNRLALHRIPINKIFVFDMISLTFLSQILIYGPSDDILRFKFFNNENLVCGSTNHTLHLINVERGEILTCVDFGDIPAPIAVSHERKIVFVGVDCSERFELINVHLPRKL